MKGKLFPLLLLLPLLASAAQGYKIVRPDGSVEYSDTPEKSAEEINLPGAQGYKSSATATASPPTGAAPATAAEGSAGNYQQLAITSPAAEATVPHGGGSVTVSVAVSPSLQAGHQLVITLDGREAARGPATSFTISGAERGAHQLGAAIVDASGATLRQSETITFYVFQPSLQNPNRR